MKKRIKTISALSSLIHFPTHIPKINIESKYKSKLEYIDDTDKLVSLIIVLKRETRLKKLI